MNLRDINDKLSTNLGLIINKLKIENSSNNLSLNVILETPFLDIINIIYGYKLVNSNLIQSNFTAIDGIDKINRVMVQVSSSYSLEKINNTIDKIIEKEIYLNFDTLYFVFLNENKRITKSSQENILKKIDSKFNFSFSENVIDISLINRLLINQSEITKIIEVNKILESILFNIETNIENNHEYIGLSFEDDEIENAYIVSKILIKMGLKILVDDDTLLKFFLNKNSIYANGLTVIKSGGNYDFLKNNIIIVSNKYILNNIHKENPKCKIFKYCKSKLIRSLQLNFGDFTDDINDNFFKNPRTVSANNIDKIQELISHYLKPKNILKYSFNDIQSVLKSLFPTHKFINIIEEKNFCVYNFNYKNSVINFLIFSHDYRRNEVLKSFDLNYKKKYSENLFILLPKDYNQTTANRIKYIKERYQYAETVFIDEYLFENSLKKINQEKLLLNDVFIPPFLNTGKVDDIEKIDDVFDWLKYDDSPVAFIIGSGGDGKTTVCHKIHDVIIKEFENTIVVFLDAQSYINQIKQREKVDNWKFDLQTVFEFSNTEVGVLDINTFKSNFAFGNIVVIIDGIDEIISTLPNFSLIDFLEDFNSLKENIGRGKIIINCRDIYIEELNNVDLNFKNRYKIYNLLKFNKELSIKYFKKYFTDNEKKVDHSIKVLDEFYDDIKRETYIYSPFILEIIVIIVENDFDYDEIEYVFDSNILTRTYNNDYLIYKILKREIAKKEKNGFIIPIDSYVRLLGLIAIEKNGSFNLEDFKLFLKKINVNLNSEKVKSSIKDNPFFCFEKDKYHFRFDFYISLFKYQALFSKIMNSNSFELTNSFINVISQELNFNSLIFKGLNKKIQSSNTNFKIIQQKIKELIFEIRDYDNTNISLGYDYEKKIAISNLVVFLNELKDKEITTTQIIVSIFNDQTHNDTIVINKLCLIDIPEHLNFIVNFSNMYCSNVTIENFQNFFNCTFNENSFFDNTCRISKIENEKLKIKNCTITKNNFDDYIFTSDNSLYKTIEFIQSGGENVPAYLKRYFRSFQKGSKIIEKINCSELPKTNLGSIELNKINMILFNNNILKEINTDDVSIHQSVKLKISKFINQNITFVELNRAIAEINKVALNN